MANPIRLQDWTKARLDAIVDSEGHTSYDSAVKSLLKDREIAHEQRTQTSNDELLPTTMRQDPLRATDPLTTPSDLGGVNVVLGNIASGKTTTITRLYRHIAETESNLHTVFLSARGEYDDLADEVGATHICLDSNVAINPLDIREAPADILERENIAINPYGSKIRAVMEFFRTYLDEAGTLFSSHRAVLERAVRLAYERNGITRDPATHGKQSPVVNDVLDVLQEMTLNAIEFARSGSETEREGIERDASKLLVALEPFQEDGEFENLSRETEINISSSSVSYVDLRDMDATGRPELLTQLVFSHVAEHAKQHDGPVLLIADDLGDLIHDAASLNFLTDGARNYRHWGLSAWTVWMSPHDVLAFDDGPALFERAAHIYLHHLDQIDAPAAKQLGLNHHHIQFVQSALDGDPNAGSEVLVRGRDGAWNPYRVPPSGVPTGE